MNKDKLVHLLNKLNFPEIDSWKSNKDNYSINLTNSDDYARYYSKLDASEDFNFTPDESASSEHITTLSYNSDNYNITLNANLDADKYNIVIKELKNNVL